MSTQTSFDRYDPLGLDASLSSDEIAVRDTTREFCAEHVVPHVAEWLDELKVAWEGKDPDRVLQLFKDTKRYYERPFHPGTSQEEYRTYWE